MHGHVHPAASIFHPHLLTYLTEIQNDWALHSLVAGEAGRACLQMPMHLLENTNKSHREILLGYDNTNVVDSKVVQFEDRHHLVFVTSKRLNHALLFTVNTLAR